MPSLLDAPIPGQSLTRPPKSSPMEQPPAYVDRAELQDYFFEKLTSKSAVKKILLLLKTDASVESIARTLLYTGVIQGMYTPDLMLLTAKDVYYLVLAIAEASGEDFTAKNPDVEMESFIDYIIPALRDEGQAIDTPIEEAAVTIFSMEELDDDEPLINLGGME